VKPLDFFQAHPVFTRDEFARAVGVGRSTVDSHLGRYLRLGRIGRVKRGMFFAAGPGETASKSPVDFLLVASRMAPDAVLSHHSALEAHGYAQSLYERFFFLTERKSKPVTFRGRTFVPVTPPTALRRKGLSFAFATQVERQRLTCRVTSVERTVVDALDRPDLTGGLEEAWRSLPAVPLLDLRELLEYVRLRNQATLAAKVGLFLERHQRQFGVTPDLLGELRALRPRQPHYLDRSARGRLVPGWNLIVPPALMEGEWEAVG
jgi:predicted transcriptional regulator of viral defense system